MPQVSARQGVTPAARFGTPLALSLTRRIVIRVHWEASVRQRGFTLIELMITATVIALILAFTLPNFTGYLKDVNNRQVRSNLLQDLRMARQLAVTEHRPVIVAFGTSGVTTDVTTYSVHMDTNANRVKDSGESWYRHNLPSGTKFTKVNLTPTDSLIFDISGVLWPGTSGGSIIVYERTRPDTLYVSAAGIVFQP
jgi:prepilin-type N-terminal cleavage/methylation domain-containing protein